MDGRLGDRLLGRVDRYVDILMARFVFRVVALKMLEGMITEIIVWEEVIYILSLSYLLFQNTKKGFQKRNIIVT